MTDETFSKAAIIACDGFPEHVCEVAPNMPAIAQARMFVDITRVTMIEPHPLAAQAIRDQWGSSVDFHEVAVTDMDGEVIFVDTHNPDGKGYPSGCSYVEGVEAPFTAFPASKQAAFGTPTHRRVQSVRFDTIDDGTIDALALDCEGAEWFVLKYLVSRPRIIAIELKGYSRHTNPHEPAIRAWLRDNGYEFWYKVGKSDEVFTLGAPPEDKIV